ncbi:MAG TPA: hypothetical protein VI454_00660 [Verrucomicrobiae bacterium]
MNTGERKEIYPQAQSNGPAELREAVARPHRLADDDPSPMQITLWRAMTGQRRLKLAEAMYWEARGLKTAGVRYQHPDWPEEKVTAEVNRIFLNARS